MSFDWTDYLVVANKLVSMAADRKLAEGYYRTAISRAYYAAFNKAKEALPPSHLHNLPKNADVHVRVRQTYEGGSTPNEKQIGDDLDTLRIARNLADYNPAWTDARKQCYAELRKAKRIIGRLGNISPQV